MFAKNKGPTDIKADCEDLGVGRFLGAMEAKDQARGICFIGTIGCWS